MLFYQTNKSLEALDLSWNCLGQAGAEAVKVALKINTTFRVLDLTQLSNCQFSISMLFYRTNNLLEVLDLSWNGLCSGSDLSM